MNNRPNPFAVLGLSPEILSGLRSEDIQILINGAKKSLQMIHHPDRGGDKEKSELINWAVTELDQEDPDRFEAYLKQHTETDAAKKASELLQLQVGYVRQGRVKTILWRKWLQCVSNHDSIAAARRQVRIYLSSPEHENDIGTSLNHRSSSALMRQRERIFDIASNGDLTIHNHQVVKSEKSEKQGVIGVRDLQRKSIHIEAGQKTLLGCISDQDFRDLGGIDGIFRLCAPEVMRPNTIGRLKGSSLPNSEIDPLKRQVISLDNFAAVAEHLAPFLLTHGILFSLNQSGDQPMIECEGEVTKIARIKPRTPTAKS